MSKLQLLFILIASVLHVPPSFADARLYECEVLSAQDLQADGTLSASSFAQIFTGSKFTVNTETGVIEGQVLPTVFADEVFVIYPGDKENSFRAAATWTNGYAGRRMQLINIKTWTEAVKIPFVSMSMSGAGIVTGLCNDVGAD